MARIKTLFMVTAVLFCMVPMAGKAVSLSLNGRGQVLLYPYYNVNQGNITFVSVTNSTVIPKAVKVRFREGVGGEAVFDFTLYLSPYDVWVGAVFRQGGEVRLSVPSDTSCTVPNTSSLVATGFSAARIDAAYDPDGDGIRSDDEVLARLSEGFIEVFDMADLPATESELIWWLPPYPTEPEILADIGRAVVHNQAASPVEPPDCTVPALFSATSGLGAILDERTVTASGVGQRFNTPTGGLFGSAAVFNAASGIYFPYNATALEQFTSNPIWWPQNGEFFTHVEGAEAGVDSNGNSIENYRTADDGSTVPAADGTLNADLPDLSTPSVAEVAADNAGYEVASRVAASGSYAINRGSFGGGVAAGNDAKQDKAVAVTAALTGRLIHTEFITSGNYSTDWVVTFPSAYTRVSDTDVDEPFTVLQTPSTGRACHAIEFDYWNREEERNPIDYDIGPPLWPDPEPIAFCYQANIMAINGVYSEYSDAITSKAVRNFFPLVFADGWAYIDFSSYSVTPTLLEAGDASGSVLGLPVIGFTAVADVVTGSERGGVFDLRITADQQ